MLIFLRNLLFGMFLGLGQLLPAIGWQTVSLVSGIYDEILTFFSQLLSLLKNLFLFLLSQKTKDELKESVKQVDWKFGIPILLGIGILIFLVPYFSKFSQTNIPNEILRAVSFGIILATVVIMFREFRRNSWQEVGIFITTFAAFMLFFGLQNLSSVSTDTNPVFFTPVGLLISITLFFPGNITSSILSIFSFSTPLNTLFSSFSKEYLTLGTFSSTIFLAIGFLTGIILTVFVIAKAMDKYRILFHSFIFGITAATLRLVWPFAFKGVEIAPWKMSLSAVTQQLIIIGVSFGSVLILRFILEKSKLNFLGFGTQKRTIIN